MRQVWQTVMFKHVEHAVDTTVQMVAYQIQYEVLDAVDAEPDDKDVTNNGPHVSMPLSAECQLAVEPETDEARYRRRDYVRRDDRYVKPYRAGVEQREVDRRRDNADETEFPSLFPHLFTLAPHYHYCSLYD